MNMELQQTEIGAFPATWVVDRVDAAFDIQQGKQVSKKNRDGEHQRPFLRTKNIFWNRLELTDLDQMHFSEAEQSRLELCTNDLLVCEGGSIGRTALWNNEVDGCLYQNHLHRLRVKGYKADPQFGVYWLWYAFDVAKLYFGRGNVTTIPNLSQSKLAELPMALPPLPEQKKIAHILSTVQRAIGAQERIIQTTTELKKALMQKLFTEGLRNEPQKQTEIGPVPESWEVVSIGDYCDVSTGTTPSTKYSKYYIGNNPFIKTGEITNNRISGSSVCISDEAIEKYNLKVYEPGTLLIAMYGQGKTRGQVSILDVPASTSQNAGAIVPRLEIDSEYLWNFLISQYEQLRRSGIEGHISHLNLGYIKNILFPKPSLKDQRKIASTFRGLDRKALLHQKKQEILLDLFRTLLHELMTANTRVNQLNLPAA